MCTIFKVKSEFAKNVLTLMTGTTLAQAIPIALTPILTRIYSPQDFGVLAIFIAICTIFGSVASGRYELAIMNPESDIDARNLVFLGGVIAFFISLLLLIITFFFNENIIGLIGEPSLEGWLYFVPIVVFLTGLFNVFNYLNIRDKKFNIVARSGIYKASTVASTQVVVGLYNTNGYGLISGYIVGQFVVVIKLMKSYFSADFLVGVNRLSLFKVAKRYKKFPLISSFSALCNVASQQVPLILLGLFYATNVAGFFSVASRILIIPVNVIGAAFGQVFFQRTSSCNSIDDIKIVTYATVKKLVLIGFIPFSFVLAFGDILAVLALGGEWEVAGLYMQKFSLWLYFVFITSPITNLYATLERQKEALLFNFLLLVLRISSIVIGYYILSLSDDVVTLFAVVGALSWALWFSYTVKMVGLNVLKLLGLALIPFTTAALLFILGRFFNGI